MLVVWLVIWYRALNILCYSWLDSI
uniref:Uncharacterized protein n=1 Tax=Arundo donax TaxID=35708 RepID=A0A0A8Y3X5_ARUDO